MTMHSTNTLWSFVDGDGNISPQRYFGPFEMLEKNTPPGHTPLIGEWPVRVEMYGSGMTMAELAEAMENE
jgi:hypothetical protein